jgi:hypothetical protein
MIRRPFVRSAILSCSVAALLSACGSVNLSTIGLGSDKPSSPPPKREIVSTAADQTIWTANGAFVRVEAQDAGPRNAQPARISPDQIRRALSQVKVRESSDREPVDIVTPEEIALLATQISKAFAVAGPNQDVTVASIGLFTNEIYMKSQKVTTFRLFWTDAGLNIIFGQVHDDARETENLLRREDERTRPYIPGMRAQSATHKWDLIVGGAGITAHDANRDDWLVFAPSALTGAPPLPNNVTVPQQPSYTAPAAPGYAAPPTYAVPAAPPAAQQPIEQRLEKLEELRRKGLITDEEAKEKRKQLLEGL